MTDRELEMQAVDAGVGVIESEWWALLAFLGSRLDDDDIEDVAAAIDCLRNWDEALVRAEYVPTPLPHPTPEKDYEIRSVRGKTPGWPGVEAVVVRRSAD